MFRTLRLSGSSAASTTDRAEGGLSNDQNLWMALGLVT